MKKKSVFLLIAFLAIGLVATATVVAQTSGGTPDFVTKDGEVWADDTWGLIFQSDGKVFDVIYDKEDDCWVSQRQNGTWTGNTWDGKTLSVSGNTLTLSYVSYIDDETGEERISTDTYIKVTGQDVVIRH